MGAAVDGERFDAVILGAGPAGCATALALARAGVGHILLVDRPPPGRFRIGETAAPSVAPSLRRLGLPDDLAAAGHLACQGTVSLWGGERPAVEDYLRRGQGLGWHLDRLRFDETLRAACVAAGVRLASPATLAAVAPLPFSGFRLAMRQGDEIMAILADQLVDATGRAAWAAANLGAAHRKLDRLVALATLIEASEAADLQGFSLIEAAPYGWWYAARIPGNRAVVTLMTDHDVARDRDLFQPTVFREAWARTRLIASRMPPPAAETLALSVFPATTQSLDRALGPDWIAVGDALLAYDPLTSAGIGGAIDDGLAAAEVVLARLDGTAAARTAERAYESRFERMATRYFTERCSQYARETRWPAAPFWGRRTVPLTLRDAAVAR